MATIQYVQKKIDTKFKTLKLLEKDTLRIYDRSKESELIKQKQLHEKRLDEINSLKMEILEGMIENKHRRTKKKLSRGQKAIEQQLRFTTRKLKRSRTESLR